jgi:hypothetical protein
VLDVGDKDAAGCSLGALVGIALTRGAGSDVGIMTGAACVATGATLGAGPSTLSFALEAPLAPVSSEPAPAPRIHCSASTTSNVTTGATIASDAYRSHRGLTHPPFRVPASCTLFAFAFLPLSGALS